MSTYDIPPPDIGDEIEAWTQARLGKATASRIWEAIAKTKKGWSAYRLKYMSEIIAERLTGMREDVFLSQDMIWGAQSEYEAGIAYERRTKKKLKRGWVFIDHPTIRHTGASPDAMVDDDGLIEIKCLKSATHIRYLLTREIPEEHMAQMQWQLACTRRAWVDYCCYEPRLPAALRLNIVRVERNDEAIAEMEMCVSQFQDEIDQAIQSINDVCPA